MYVGNIFGPSIPISKSLCVVNSKDERVHVYKQTVYIHTHTYISEHSWSVECLLYDLRSVELTWSNRTMTPPDLHFSGANFVTKSCSPCNTCVGSIRRGCISEQAGLPCSLAERVHTIHHKYQNILLVFMKCS